MADKFRKSRVALPPLKETGNTEADAAALALGDGDSDGESGIVGQPEEV